ncbi:LOW QUALITY PROTEIN: hypothetical protein KUTeg_012019 [Tegillarca granosa]|uniref:Uncharacterized protein n=1 Tax=Tegillarca granosa TaxID=220873 RepID=A0ABQ9EYJ6_TEGGR|nr:LOW QUALITY PROTEIN: hypothetical protein KUTeg_012019 [Tegillarca granosa]
MASIEILKGPDGKEKEEINSNNEDRKYQTTTYIKSCNLTTELQNGKCVEALQNGRAMDGVTNEITSGSINSNSNIGNSDTEQKKKDEEKKISSGHREIFDLCDFLEKNKQKQTCCKTDVLSCYLWRFIRLATQNVTLGHLVTFTNILPYLPKRKIINEENNITSKILDNIFCIINLNFLNFKIYRKIKSDAEIYSLSFSLVSIETQYCLLLKLGLYIVGLKDQPLSSLSVHTKTNLVKRSALLYTVIILWTENIYNCIAHYRTIRDKSVHKSIKNNTHKILQFTLMTKEKYQSPLEICAFSASSFFIPCVIRTLCERKDFRFKNNLCYIIYVAIYCLGFSGVALVIQYNSFTLNGRFYLILTSISMLLFGLKYLPLTDEQQKKGISNICLVIACASRILTAVLLTLYFYPNIGSIAFLVNEIKRNCGHHSNEGPMINQSHLQLVHNSSPTSQGINGFTTCIQYKLYIPFFVCIVTSYLCYHFAITACRLRMQQTSFALPISIALPCYVSFLIFVELDIITVPNFELVFKRHQKEIHVYLLLGSFAKQESSRIEPCKHTEESKSLLNNTSYDDVKKMRPKIFVCATMWHETLEEMKILLTSIFRRKVNEEKLQRLK